MADKERARARVDDLEPNGLLDADRLELTVSMTLDLCAFTHNALVVGDNHLFT